MTITQILEEIARPAITVVIMKDRSTGEAKFFVTQRVYRDNVYFKFYDYKDGKFSKDYDIILSGNAKTHKANKDWSAITKRFTYADDDEELKKIAKENLGDNIRFVPSLRFLTKETGVAK